MFGAKIDPQGGASGISCDGSLPASPRSTLEAVEPSWSTPILNSGVLGWKRPLESQKVKWAAFAHWERYSTWAHERL